MKKIKDVFASYCDAYLEYRNNFLTIECFCDYYELNKDEFLQVYNIVHNEIKKFNLSFCAIDYYMSLGLNKDKITFEND